MRKLLSLLLILGGCALFLYPLGSNLFNVGVVRSEFHVYEKEYQNHTPEENAARLQKAKEYNQSILTMQVSLQDPFNNRINDKKSEQVYASLLDWGGQGLMGFLEIPCIDEKLPIYHGTSEAVLKKGVGHLKGSSLPVGGAGTHAVLTGHTGMNRAKIFTDLTRVQIGDLFYIYTAGETLAYRVDQIRVVLPQETDLLSVVRGKDLVTLVTCTPYGVNDHRLFVRGERTSYSDTAYENEKNKIPDSDSPWLLAYQKAALAGFLAMGSAGVLYAYRKKRKYRGRK